MLRRTDGLLVYPLDDSYIQMAIAKNVAGHGIWGVTSFEFSGGGSSLLWPLVLAAVNALGGAGGWTPLGLNVIFAGAVLWAADAVMRRHVASGRMRLAALALLIIATPLYVIPLIGMEHVLQTLLALSLAATGATLAADDRASRWTAALGTGLAALTVAVRYDTASVPVTIVGVLLVMRRWRQAAPIAAGMALPVVVYAVVATANGWPPVPTPVLLKQRLADVHGFGWHQAADVLGGGALAALADVPHLFALVIVAAAMLAFPPADEPADDRLEREANVLLVVFVGAVLLHAQFGRFGWLHRYSAYLVAFGIVAVASAAGHHRVARWRPRPLQAIAAAGLALLFVSPLLLRSVRATRDTLTETRAVYEHEYQIGRFFEHHPQHGAVMTGDIGTIAYFGEMPIVDISGLASREFIDMRMAGDYDEELFENVAAARDVQVVLTDWPMRDDPGWRCVGSIAPRTGDNRWATFLNAADDETAGRLDTGLRAFRTEDVNGVNDIRLATEDAAVCEAQPTGR